MAFSEAFWEAFWMRTSALCVPLVDINTNFPGSAAGLRLDLSGSHAHKELLLRSHFRSCAGALPCKDAVGKRSDLVSAVPGWGQWELHGKGCVLWGKWQSLEAERSQRRKIACISWQAFAVVSSCTILLSLDFELLWCVLFLARGFECDHWKPETC